MNAQIDSTNCTIGIICGGGNYPRYVATACVEQNIKFCLAILDNHDFSDFNADFLRIKLGKVKRVLNFFKDHNVTHVVFAGYLKRPKISELRLDLKGLAWLLKLGISFLKGDDALLRAVANLFHNEGFEIIAGTDLLSDIFIKCGIVGTYEPSDNHLRDIEIGICAAKHIGICDIGQCVIVHNEKVIGTESDSGTDSLIRSCSHDCKGAILVKISKPQQDTRLDLPTIGENTIELLHAYNFAGIAIEAEKCIVLNKSNTIKLANAYNMFIYGV